MGGSLNSIRCLIILAVPSMAFAQGILNPGGSDALRPFEGPNVFGRSTGGFGSRGVGGVPIRPFLGLSGSYDNNLLTAGVDQNGRFIPLGSAGVEASWGAYGQKRMKRSQLGLDYRGNWSQFTRGTFFNGTNQQIGISYANRLSKRWVFDTTTVGGTSNRAIGAPAFFTTSELEFLNVPSIELFDARFYYLQNHTSASYYISNRQSARFSGFGGTTRRRATFLADAQIYGASADWSYRLNPRTTIGTSYTFSHFDFSKVFGESDVHQVSVVVGQQFGRGWELQIGLSGFKQSTVGVREISLDPVLVALLGRSVGREVFETNNMLGGYLASISRTLRGTVISARTERAVMPGNGFFLTSRRDMHAVSAGHTFRRGWNLSADLGYSTLLSQGFVSEPFRSWNYGGSINYQIRDNLSCFFRVDGRKFDLGNTFARSGYRANIGIMYSPSDVMNLW
jgi:hypothetical protein